jgi:hypothetical protein
VWWWDGLLLRNRLTDWCLDPLHATKYQSPGELVVRPCMATGGLQQQWIWAQEPGSAPPHQPLGADVGQPLPVAQRVAQRRSHTRVHTLWRQRVHFPRVRAFRIIDAIRTPPEALGEASPVADVDLRELERLDDVPAIGSGMLGGGADATGIAPDERGTRAQASTCTCTHTHTHTHTRTVSHRVSQSVSRSVSQSESVRVTQGNYRLAPRHQTCYYRRATR